jgi:hypothetical protein
LRLSRLESKLGLRQKTAERLWKTASYFRTIASHTEKA